MFECETNEHIEITDILNYRCNRMLFLSNIIDFCLDEETNLKPANIYYINELFRNEISLLLEDLRFEDVI